MSERRNETKRKKRRRKGGKKTRAYFCRKGLHYIARGRTGRGVAAKKTAEAVAASPGHGWAGAEKQSASLINSRGDLRWSLFIRRRVGRWNPQNETRLWRAARGVFLFPSDDGFAREGVDGRGREDGSVAKRWQRGTGPGVHASRSPAPLLPPLPRSLSFIPSSRRFIRVFAAVVALRSRWYVHVSFGRSKTDIFCRRQKQSDDTRRRRPRATLTITTIIMTIVLLLLLIMCVFSGDTTNDDWSKLWSRYYDLYAYYVIIAYRDDTLLEFESARRLWPRRISRFGGSCEPSGKNDCSFKVIAESNCGAPTTLKIATGT